MPEYISKNVADTTKVATELAKKLTGGELVALSGNLGAGKTVFVKALAESLGVKDVITSPTFVLMKVYVPDNKKINKFVHVDCYRLEGQEDLSDIGLGDYLNDDKIIVVVEWADKVLNLPAKTIRVNIDYRGGDKRHIVID